MPKKTAVVCPSRRFGQKFLQKSMMPVTNFSKAAEIPPDCFEYGAMPLKSYVIPQNIVIIHHRKVIHQVRETE